MYLVVKRLVVVLVVLSSAALALSPAYSQVHSKVAVALDSPHLSPDVTLLGFQSPNDTHCWNGGQFYVSEDDVVACWESNPSFADNNGCATGAYVAVTGWQVDATFMTHPVTEHKVYQVVGREIYGDLLSSPS